MFDKLTRPVLLAVAALALVVIPINVSAQIQQDQDVLNEESEQQDNYYLQDHGDFNENGIPDNQEGDTGTTGDDQEGDTGTTGDDQDLPATAGALPLLAMLGGFSIAGAVCARFAGRAKNL